MKQKMSSKHKKREDDSKSERAATFTHPGDCAGRRKRKKGVEVHGKGYFRNLGKQGGRQTSWWTKYGHHGVKIFIRKWGKNGQHLKDLVGTKPRSK